MTISPKIRKKAIKKSQTLGKEATEKDVENVEKNLSKMNRGPIKKVWSAVQALWRAFKSDKTPLETKIAIIGALIYLVSPLDIFPDIFPAGLLDDAAVIAFIYKQCKDLILDTIPKTGEEIKKSIHDISNTASREISHVTENAIADTIGKKFSAYNLRIFLNSVLKLSLFALAFILRKLSFPTLTSSIIISRSIIAVTMFWILISLASSFANFIKNFSSFVSTLKEINVRENQNALSIKNYKKLRFADKLAETFYIIFTKDIQNARFKKHEKLYAFVFRKWNEGALPHWVGGKKELAYAVWNALKVKLLIFIFTVSAYLLIYNFLAKPYL